MCDNIVQVPINKACDSKAACCQSVILQVRNLDTPPLLKGVPTNYFNRRICWSALGVLLLLRCSKLYQARCCFSVFDALFYLELLLYTS